MNELLKRLRKLVNDGIKQGRDPADIERDMNKLIDSFNVGDQKQAIIDKMKNQYNWVTSKTVGAEVQKDVAGILSKAGSQYAKTKTGLLRDVVSRVNPLLQKGADRKDIVNELESIIGKTRFNAETIARTAISGFDGTNAAVQAEKAGTDRYTYQGPPAERFFCQNLLNESAGGRSWTRAEIEAMDNGQGLDPFIYKGGYNCRHFWEPAEEVKA